MNANETCDFRNWNAAECGLDAAAVCASAMRIEPSDCISAQAHGRGVGRRRTFSQWSKLLVEAKRHPLDGENPCHVLRQHVPHRWQIDHLFQRGNNGFFFFFSPTGPLKGENRGTQRKNFACGTFAGPNSVGTHPAASERRWRFWGLRARWICVASSTSHHTHPVSLGT